MYSNLKYILKLNYLKKELVTKLEKWNSVILVFPETKRRTPLNSSLMDSFFNKLCPNTCLSNSLSFAMSTTSRLSTAALFDLPQHAGRIKSHRSSGRGLPSCHRFEQGPQPSLLEWQCLAWSWRTLPESGEACESCDLAWLTHCTHSFVAFSAAKVNGRRPHWLHPSPARGAGPLSMRGWQRRHLLLNSSYMSPPFPLFWFSFISFRSLFVLQILIFLDFKKWFLIL